LVDRLGNDLLTCTSGRSTPLNPRHSRRTGTTGEQARSGSPLRRRHPTAARSVNGGRASPAPPSVTACQPRRSPIRRNCASWWRSSPGRHGGRRRACPAKPTATRRMLAVALLVLALRQVSSAAHWDRVQRYLRVSFWGLNLGLAGMVVL